MNKNEKESGGKSASERCLHFQLTALVRNRIGLLSLSLSLSLSLPPSVFFLNLTLSIPSASSFFLLVIPTTQSVDNPAVVVHVFSSSSSFFFFFVILF